MARFFFNLIEMGKFDKDDEGIELSGFDEIRAAVMLALPDIAREELPKDGDHRSLVLLVTDHAGHPVYSGTLSFTGIRLRPETYPYGVGRLLENSKERDAVQLSRLYERG
jgi:hypothetical protein